MLNVFELVYIYKFYILYSFSKIHYSTSEEGAKILCDFFDKLSSPNY